MKRRHFLLGSLATGSALRGAAAEEPPAGDRGAGRADLGIRGSRFTLDGKPAFLLGFSYYGGLGAGLDDLRRDLDDFAARGFNWLRVWATWGMFGQEISAFDGTGSAREPSFGKLISLVEECGRRGLAVDVTLARQEAARIEEAEGLLPNAAAHRRAVEILVRELRPHRNWYLDLANERDVRDARHVSPEELRALRDLAREVDPERLVTASFGGHDLGEDDVRETLREIGADFLCPHRPRHAGSPEETEAATRRALALAEAAAGRPVPVHYQEPFRRGYTDWEPGADDFLEDLRGALAGGAAGWCFHNGTQRGAPGQKPRRSFDLRERRLFDQLDEEERRFVDGAGKAVESGFRER